MKGLGMIKIRSVIANNVPNDVKEYNQWVAWKAIEKKEGKVDKIPINPKNSHNASVSDPETWGTFNQAEAYYERNKGNGIAGIGFVFTENDPFCGIDLDGCRNPETNEYTQKAKEILSTLNSYSEISPLNRGVKILVKAKLLGKGRTSDGVEIYDRGRFFTITGGWLGNYSGHIEDRSKEVLELYQRLGGGADTNGRNPPGWQDPLIKGVSSGSRHGTALRLAGRWMEKGHSEQEIIHFIISWNESNDPPKTELSDPNSKEMRDIISYVRGKNKQSPGKRDVSARVREYLLEEFDGGFFKISDLRRELGLDDSQYTVARNCIRRMVEQGHLQKHGHQLGCYRVVDKKKTCIDWEATEASPSNIRLPGNLHEIVTIRDGDMICFAGYKNHSKTALAIETCRLNLNNFKVHFFITEYRARMKRRLLDFGVDLKHPNLNAYQIEKSDYVPDKIESGSGVLNIIDHFPNLDSFYLVGKYQDELHRALDGAICVITHQKKNPDDNDAIGGSFWTITPTLAVTLFWDDKEEYQGRMNIRKGKEPGEGWFNANNLSLRYRLKRGCQFDYDPKGWK